MFYSFGGKKGEKQACDPPAGGMHPSRMEHLTCKRPCSCFCNGPWRTRGGVCCASVAKIMYGQWGASSTMLLTPEGAGASTQIGLFADPYAAGVILSHLPPPPSPSAGTKPCPDPGGQQSSALTHVAKRVERDGSMSSPCPKAPLSD